MARLRRTAALAPWQLTRHGEGVNSSFTAEMVMVDGQQWFTVAGG